LLIVMFRFERGEVLSQLERVLSARSMPDKKGAPYRMGEGKRKKPFAPRI